MDLPSLQTDDNPVLKQNSRKNLVPYDPVKLTKRTDRQAEDGSGDTPLGKYTDGQAVMESTLVTILTHHGFSRFSGLCAWV